MPNWTSGYVADIDYTYGYYSELNPLRAQLIFLNAGLIPPTSGIACELGFGQGLSVNLHAAASITKWYGTDFNPSQAAFGQELAPISGAQLYDQAFTDFTQRSDLPDFDYIGLHGIWSWISDENRAAIVNFIRQKLKVGGVLYVSYNTLPGWAAFAPMRHLMTEHVDRLASQGNGIISGVEGAIAFAEKLLAKNPIYSTANPQVGERLNNMKSNNRHYLAHEYFNRDWHPMYFSTMARWLESAKLQYASSANFIDTVNQVNLTPDQQEFLREIPDAMFRETVRDFIVNAQFRKDYWIKGARRLSPLEQLEGLRKQRVVLISHRPDVPLKFKGTLGEASMSEVIYGPVLDLLADHKVRLLGEMFDILQPRGLALPQIIQAVMVLIGTGHLAAAQDDSISAKAKKQTDKLNALLCARARSHNDISFVASPVVGGGIALDRFQQLFLASFSENQKQPEDWAAYAWQVLSGQGQKLVRDGKGMETVEENMAELNSKAQSFAEKTLPILRALKIA